MVCLSKCSYMELKEASRFPDSSPALIDSTKDTGSMPLPFSSKLEAMDLPASTSVLTFPNIFLRGLSVVLSYIRFTARPMGTPDLRIMANWEHITVKALGSSLFPPKSMVRKLSFFSFTSDTFKTMSYSCLMRSTASISL